MWSPRDHESCVELIRADVLDEMRISPGWHFRNGAFAVGVSSAGVDDLVISEMQFAGPVFTRPHFNENVPGVESARTVTSSSARSPNVPRGVPVSIQGPSNACTAAPNSTSSNGFSKLQCAISSALCDEIGRDTGNERKNTRFRQDAFHFAEKCDCAWKRRIEIEDDQFRLVLERKPPRFRQ